jgi:DNA-binding phage protein
MTKSIPFAAVLLKHLKDPQQAVAYLNAALEENDSGLFLAALKDVAQAQGITTAASESVNLAKLMESLRRHGISNEVLTSAVAELNSDSEAA